MKILEITIVLLFLIQICSCENGNHKVLIGLSIEENYFPDRIFSSENNNAIVLSNDSIEFIPLQRGCILSPVNTSKLKFNEGIDDSLSIYTEDDTVKLKFNRHRNNIYSYTIEYHESKYIPAINAYINAKFDKVVESFTGDSFSILSENKKTNLTFHNNDEYIMNEQVNYLDKITKGRWYIKKLDNYYFLILDDFKSIKKFQILELSNESIKICDFNNSSRKELVMVRNFYNSSFYYGKIWVSETSKSPPLSDQYMSTAKYISEYWLNNNDALVIYDSSTIHNLEKNKYPTSIYVDWGCNAIINEYKMVLGFEIDKINNEKIIVYPTDREGKINKDISKIFQLK